MERWGWGPHGVGCNSRCWTTRCFWCGKPVLFFSCSCGSKVLFDDPETWAKHECGAGLAAKFGVQPTFEDWPAYPPDLDVPRDFPFLTASATLREFHPDFRHYPAFRNWMRQESLATICSLINPKGQVPVAVFELEVPGRGTVVGAALVKPYCGHFLGSKLIGSRYRVTLEPFRLSHGIHLHLLDHLQSPEGGPLPVS